MKKSQRNSIIVAGLLAAVAAVFVHAVGSGGKEGGSAGPVEEETVYAVSTTKVEIRDIQEYLEVNGDVITETSVEIYPEVSGKLVRLNVALGDRVEKDQVIAEVDPSKPGQEYARSPVKATISGTVISVSGRIGATVSTSSSIAQIGITDSIQLKALIPERDVGKVKIGEEALVAFEAYPGETFRAKVTRMSPVLDSVSRTKEIRLLFLGGIEKINVGMYGKAKLLTNLRKNCLTVADAVILKRGGEAYVFVVSADRRTVEKRTVERGLEVDGTAEILSGLKAGEEIVSEGRARLQNGVKVKIVTAKGTQS